MRLHRLEVTAFGPFADTATVDFDALSAAGLFLLSGATGAGKTSVLDAVCFALYGAVPGERNDARRLRSDQAAADTPPRVVLDATLAGRRFRIVRSPAWSRPKKRGSGTTQQQASVVISERVDGAWVPLSTRLDETGHLVTALVGMNLTQFTQVAMLPQGRFQAFLRASSEDRHRLLQQLFRTERFEQVERWLRDRRLDLRPAQRRPRPGGRRAGPPGERDGWRRRCPTTPRSPPSGVPPSCAPSVSGPRPPPTWRPRCQAAEQVARAGLDSRARGRRSCGGVMPMRSASATSSPGVTTRSQLPRPASTTPREPAPCSPCTGLAQRCRARLRRGRGARRTRP